MDTSKKDKIKKNISLKVAPSFAVSVICLLAFHYLTCLVLEKSSGLGFIRHFFNEQTMSMMNTKSKRYSRFRLKCQKRGSLSLGKYICQIYKWVIIRLDLTYIFSHS